MISFERPGLYYHRVRFGTNKIFPPALRRRKNFYHTNILHWHRVPAAHLAILFVRNKLYYRRKSYQEIHGDLNLRPGAENHIHDIPSKCRKPPIEASNNKEGKRDHMKLFHKNESRELYYLDLYPAHPRIPYTLTTGKNG